jgi:hypothetical protein
MSLSVWQQMNDWRLWLRLVRWTAGFLIGSDWPGIPKYEME